MVNILNMHRRHGGFAWHVHDERFRRLRALAPDKLGFGYGRNSDCGRMSVRHATAALSIRPAP